MASKKAMAARGQAAAELAHKDALGSVLVLGGAVSNEKLARIHDDRMAEILARKQPVRRRVVAVLDEEAEVALDEARARLADSTTPKTVAAARSEVGAAEKRLADVTVEFLFRALGRADYRALVEAHPPTDAQRFAARARGELCEFHPDTFPPALLAAVCEEPAMTVDEARELLDGWTVGEAALIWNLALEVCLSGSVRQR